MEVWKQIPHSTYEASSLGRIRRSDGRVLRPGLSRGYEHVGLRFLDRKLTIKVHHLVCLAFNGVRPKGSECVRDRDGNKRNNTPVNLRWGTNLENAQDTILHGRQVCGFDHPNMKIKKFEARAIRKDYLKHMTERKKVGGKHAANDFVLSLVKSYKHLGYKTVYKAAIGRYDEME